MLLVLADVLTLDARNYRFAERGNDMLEVGLLDLIAALPGLASDWLLQFEPFICRPR